MSAEEEASLSNQVGRGAAVPGAITESARKLPARPDYRPGELADKGWRRAAYRAATACSK